MSRRPVAQASSIRLWPDAILLGVPATVVALALMFLARMLYQIRTLPERFMDWAIQFIPIDLFEQGLQKFGTSAKEIALIGTYLGFAVVLLVVAALALRARPAAIVGVAVALWLFAMAVVYPITGAGFFASALPTNVILTNVSYLGLAFAYGAVLLLTRTLIAGRAGGEDATGAPAIESRRAFVGTLVGTGVAYVLTVWFGRDAGATTSSLPLADVSTLKLPTPVPPTPAKVAAASSSVSAALPTATPTAVAQAAVASGGATAIATPTASSLAAAAPTAVATTARSLPMATPTPMPTAVAQLVIPPRPGPAQATSRDKDGALLASARGPGQLQPEYTPNNGFYITTKNAGGDPVVDPAKWRLVLDGEFAKPVQLDLPILYQLPSVQVVKTLECISNWVNMCEQVPFGCGLIGNAAWKGVRLSDIVALAGGLNPGVVGFMITGADEFLSFIPSDSALISEAVLAYEMNGQVLPLEHGYPVRLLLPGRYGEKNPKWVVEIRASKTVELDWYGRQHWSPTGIVQAMTRIDTPATAATLAAGPQQIAGIAYAGDRGVSKVEFSSDGGTTWTKATFLEDAPGKDTWIRWQGSFTMPKSGTVTLAARCVDGTGAPQNTKYTITQPDGGTALYTNTVKAG